jgi:hypothetical protein
MIAITTSNSISVKPVSRRQRPTDAARPADTSAIPVRDSDFNGTSISLPPEQNKGNHENVETQNVQTSTKKTAIKRRSAQQIDSAQQETSGDRVKHMSE